MIAHSINDDTTQQNIAKKVLATLESANRELSRFIRKTKGVETKKQYSEIRKKIKKLASDLKGQVDEDIDVDGFLENELSQIGKIYKGVGLVNYSIPSVEQVKTASTFIPYTNSSNFDSFLDNIENQFFNIWDSSVRTGYMTGMTTDNIIRNVVGAVAKDAQVAKTGTIETLRNSLVANTKTALQSFAVETRNETFRENEELFDGYKWLATLDRRTCLVCGNMDGKIFKKLSDIKDMPPYHLNCRCTIVPVIKEFEGVKGVRASENGYVSDKVTYDDWLRSQSEDLQKKILGSVRYADFKEGFKIDSFVNNGILIPINDKRNILGVIYNFSDEVENKFTDKEYTEIKERLSKINISVDEKLKKVDKKFFNDFVNGIETANKFSNIPSAVKRINVVSKGKDIFAEYDFNTDSIILNERYLKSYSDIKKCVDKLSNLYYIKNADVSWIGMHEYLHGYEGLLIYTNKNYSSNFDRINAYKNYDETANIVNDVLKNNGLSISLKNKKTRDYLINKISINSVLSQAELMVDCIGSYFTNGEKSDKICKEVFDRYVNVLRSRL